MERIDKLLSGVEKNPCSTKLCRFEGTYVCPKHAKRAYCEDCAFDRHLLCCPEEIGSPFTILRRVVKVKKLLEDLKNVDHLDLSDEVLAEYFYEHRIFADKTKEIEDQVIETVEKKEFMNYQEMNKKTMELKKDLEESFVYDHYCKAVVADHFSFKLQNPHLKFLDSTERKLNNELSLLYDNMHTSFLAKQQEFQDQVVQKAAAIEAQLSQQLKDSEAKVEALQALEVSYQQTIEGLKAELHSKARDLDAKTAEASNLQTAIEDSKDTEQKLEEQVKATDNKVKDLEEQLSQSKAEAQQVSEDAKQTEMALEAAISDKDTAANTVYNSIMDSNDKFDDQSYTLNLDMSNKKVQQFVKVMKHLKLPPLFKIIIENADPGDEDLKAFLSNCLPATLKLFDFSATDGKVVNVSGLRDTLAACLERVTERTWICYWKLEADDLSAIIKAARNSQEFITFNDCTIVLDKPLDFSTDLPYVVKHLAFLRAGDSTHSDWRNNQSDLESILKAAAASGLKQSLTEITVEDAGFTKDEIKQMLTDAGLDQIKKINV